MSALDRCEEYVGDATPTGYRRQCGRPITHQATKVTDPWLVVGLCDRHVKDYEGRAAWSVKEIAK